MIRIFSPQKNLGCLGFQLGEKIYFDIYRRGFPGAKYGLAMFVSCLTDRWHINILPVKELSIKKWK